MKVQVSLFGQRAEANLAFPRDLSRAITFVDEGDARKTATEPLRAFGLPAAESHAVAGEGYVLDVTRGGSVNCATLSLSPHGNGTHTECVGHVVEDAVSVNTVVPLVPLVAWVFTVECETLESSAEEYRGKSLANDLVISAQALHRAAQKSPDFVEGQSDLDALILRTRPPLTSMMLPPPYATDDAIAWLLEHGIHHILLETPSLDRVDDGGALSAHRAFFGLKLGQISLGEDAPSRRTVTELIHVPDDVSDGPVLLLLEVAPIESDAAPSRPVVFPLEFLSE